MGHAGGVLWPCGSRSNTNQDPTTCDLCCPTLISRPCSFISVRAFFHKIWKRPRPVRFGKWELFLGKIQLSKRMALIHCHQLFAIFFLLLQVGIYLEAKTTVEFMFFFLPDKLLFQIGKYFCHCWKNKSPIFNWEEAFYRPLLYIYIKPCQCF